MREFHDRSRAFQDPRTGEFYYRPIVTATRRPSLDEVRARIQPTFAPAEVELINKTSQLIYNLTYPEKQKRPRPGKSWLASEGLL